MYAGDTSILQIWINLKGLKIAASSNTKQVTQYFELEDLCTNFINSNYIPFQMKKVDMTLI
jgi:hypothetical protein